MILPCYFDPHALRLNFMSGTTKTIRLVITLGILFGLTIAFGLATVIAGGVNGMEITPTTLTARSFHYYQIPLIGLQITPLRKSNPAQLSATSAAISTSLSGSSPVNIPSADRWDLVWYRRGASGQQIFGDANILTTYLQAYDASYNRYWEKWTTDNPKLATILWPKIRDLAILNLYWGMPDLFSAAQTFDNPDDLKKEIDQILVNVCEIAAKHALEEKKFDAVLNISDYAILHGGGDEIEAIKAQAQANAKSS